VGVFVSNSAGAEVQAIFVVLQSNLIYLAFWELVSLCVGCLTACSSGLHHLVLELGSINQVISFYFLYFCFNLPRQFFCVVFVSGLILFQISFGHIVFFLCYS
jgi:hypothetical protein